MADTYVASAFEELYNEDGLLVMARGLGLQRVISKFLQYYSSSSSSTGVRKLVFCLNADGDEDTLRNILLSEGVVLSHLPKVLTSDTLADERADLYAEGGCFIVTSRILIMDLLKRHADPRRISGMLVCNAHKMTTTSLETFILRVFKQGNREGFVKGFSDDPDRLTSRFAKVERLLKHMYCRKLYIWPRFHARVSQCLNAAPPDVIELTQPLTHHMKAIQAGLLVAMRFTIDELKKAAPQLETQHLNLESGLSRNFDVAIKAQLEPEWHNLSFRTKELTTDLTTLRRTLEFLLQYDAVTFYSYLRTLHTAQHVHGGNKPRISLWMSSQAANTIFERSKWRVIQVLSPDEAARKKKRQKDMETKNIAINRDRERVSRPCKKADMIREALGLRSELKGYLEVPPKWTLLMDVMKEIRDEVAAKPKCPDGFNERILILVKESRAAMEIKECLATGPKTILLHRYSQYISKMCGGIRERLSRKRGSKGQHATSNTGEGRASFSRGFYATQSSRGGASTSTPDAAARVQSTGDPSINSILKESNMILEEVLKLSEEEQLIVCEEVALRDYSAVSGTKRSLSSSSLSTSSKSRKPNETVNSFFKGKNPAKDAMVTAQADLDDGNWEDDLVFDDERLERPMNAVGVDAEVEVVDDLHVMVMTISEFNQNCDIFHDFSPSRVVLYDPDVATVRALEVQQATLTKSTNERMKIYFFMYKSSADEHRYVAALEREKKSFERLIDDKASMVISVPDLPVDLTREAAADQSLTMSDTRGSLSSSNKKQANRIVVDLREFRSSLPSLLHSSSMDIVPETLVVGDYILSPDICIERKGIADLFQSFGSGRLYHQAEQMLKYYKYSALLIEFQQDKSFSLQSRSEVVNSEGIALNAISSKLAILILDFPKLKILWSRNPNATVNIFKSLKTNHQDPDVQKAIECGANTGQDDGARTDGSSKEEKARDDARSILMSLPGINNVNCRAVMNNVENLAALSKMTTAQLDPLVGPVNSKKLVAFMNQRAMK